MDKEILKALYEGEVYPSEQLGTVPGEKEMMEMCDLLWHRLGMEDQKRLDHITDQFAVVCGAYALRGFRSGFKLGARIASALYT